ncbi:MAG: helix-turn-helix transcriptional regulator [Bacilli bacterium]
MATEFGKILRIIRINSGENSRKMSRKLHISTSYLSAIENGKRNIPPYMEKLITESYSLSNKDKQKLKEVLDNSYTTVKIDLSGFSEKRKKVIFSLINNDISDETIEKICQVIKKEKDQNSECEDDENILIKYLEKD